MQSQQSLTMLGFEKQKTPWPKTIGQRKTPRPNNLGAKKNPDLGRGFVRVRKLVEGLPSSFQDAHA